MLGMAARRAEAYRRRPASLRTSVQYIVARFPYRDALGVITETVQTRLGAGEVTCVICRLKFLRRFVPAIVMCRTYHLGPSEIS